MLTFTLLCAAVRGNTQGAGRAEPEPGVGRDLARLRSRHYRDVRYALNVELSPGAEMLKGAATINLTLDNPAEDLVLDWRVVKSGVSPRQRVSRLVVNGRPAADARFVNDHIVIPAAHLRAGETSSR
jgi:hypothetical protein